MWPSPLPPSRKCSGVEWMLWGQSMCYQEGRLWPPMPRAITPVHCHNTHRPHCACMQANQHTSSQAAAAASATSTAAQLARDDAAASTAGSTLQRVCASDLSGVQRTTTAPSSSTHSCSPQSHARNALPSLPLASNPDTSAGGIPGCHHPPVGFEPLPQSKLGLVAACAAGAVPHDVIQAELVLEVNLTRGVR
jgi:hypothetical protein